MHYPKERLEIIVVSDGSTDKTNEIIEEFADTGVKLIKFSDRGGKARALNIAAPQARGEIILFSDARQLYNKDAILELVSNFSDKEVGAVSGELHILKKKPVQRLDTVEKAENENDTRSENGVGEGVGLYWKYEKFLRRNESQIDSTLGATGAIYAIRKELFSPIPEDTILDDFVIPMRVVLKGYRIIFEPKARAFDVVAVTSKKEFTRKVRTLTGNYQAFFRMKDLFNPFRNRVFFQLLSHKVFRLLVPYALVLAFISNVFTSFTDDFGLRFTSSTLLPQRQIGFALRFASLTDASSLQFLNSPTYRMILFFQMALYACAAMGFFLSKFKTAETVSYKVMNSEGQKTEKKSRILQPKPFLRFCGRLVLRLFSTSYVFVLLNWAAVVGLYRFITHRQKITWEKANDGEVLIPKELDNHGGNENA